jgi:hypothetical protein
MEKPALSKGSLKRASSSAIDVGTYPLNHYLAFVKCTDEFRWYTSLLGKLSSISSVVTLLRSLKVSLDWPIQCLARLILAGFMKIDNYGLTEFIQGHTRRWAVAWSFGTDRLPDVSVISYPLLPILLPYNSIFLEGGMRINTDLNPYSF